MKYNGTNWETVGSPGFAPGEGTAIGEYTGYNDIAIDESGTPYVAFLSNIYGGKVMVMKYDGTAWVTLGGGPVSAMNDGYAFPSIAINGDGAPYVVYHDNAADGKATVQKFNGTEWEIVGSAGFSESEATYTSMVINENGTPYVSYMDYSADPEHRLVAKRFNGDKWVTVGGGGFPGSGGFTKIAIDGNGTPYVVSSRDVNFGVSGTSFATMSRFDGTNWVALHGGGQSGLSDNIEMSGPTAIAIDGSGIPYVVYQRQTSIQADVKKYDPSNGGSWIQLGTTDLPIFGPGKTPIVIAGDGTPFIAFADYSNSNKATVMKYTGTEWEAVGVPGFTPGSVDYSLDMVMDANGILFVSYADPIYDYKATVMKYSGGEWVTVGSAGFTTGEAFPKIAVDDAGTPHVAFDDAANGGRTTVMKYGNTGWVIVGSAGFTAGGGGGANIAIDGTGTPYVVYSDNTNGNRATVMKYNGSTWVTVGTPGFSAGSAGYTAFGIDGAGTPYVGYMDGANNNNVTVMKYNGSEWTVVGSEGFTSSESMGGASSLAMAIDGNGTPHVAYSIFTEAPFTRRGVVMKYESLSSITGSLIVSPGATTVLHNTGGGTWSSNAPTTVSVNGIGIVKGLTPGTAVITYTLGECTATAVVTVTPSAKPGGQQNALAESEALFILYPNPTTTGALTIQSSISGAVVIYSMDGKQILEEQVANGVTTLSLPGNLASGMYMVRFRGDDGSSKMGKLVYEP